MLLHIFRMFIREFRKYIGVNTLNVLGLAAGLAACMMIIVFLKNEYSYDDFHEYGDRIVRVNTFQKVGEGQAIRLPSASYPVAEGLAAEVGAVENFVRFRFNRKSQQVYVGDRVFFEDNSVWADSTVFSVFSYKLIRGNPEKALTASGSVVLSESTAKKYFGDKNPLGEEIKLGEKKSYNVTGVMEDIKGPSHFPPHPMIMSMSSIEIPGKEYWVGRSSYWSYLLLAEGHTAASVQPAADRSYEANSKEILKMLNAECDITLQPLSEIHFDDGFDFKLGFQPAVTTRRIRVFAIIAALILVIASVNFINMATSRSTERAHSVGISKVLGASRRNLVAQFLGESLLTVLAALAIAFLLVELLLPVFGDFVGRELFFLRADRGMLVTSFFTLAFIIGIGAGLYPAFVLSSFRPADTIRGRFLSGSKRSITRRVLLGFQFTVAILLIIATLTINNQLSFMNGLSSGYDRDRLMVLSVGPDMTKEDCELFRSEALAQPGITNCTCSSYLPTMGHMEYTFEVTEEADCDMLMTMMFAVDPWFIETIGMEVIKGRDFNREGPGDEDGTVILNEAAVRKLGWDDPVGRQIDSHPSKDSFKPLTIIGIIRDVNFESYHHEIQPMALIMEKGVPARIALRLEEGSVEEKVEWARAAWEKNFPRSPFRYTFLDENFTKLYGREIRLGKLFTFYSVLAIIISCVGLLALIAFSTERREKEIGIRKVLGATPRSLFALLSNEYSAVVIIALVVASPVAWLATGKWLENFAYRADPAWWAYPAAGAGALVLALLTAGLYTWRVCRINPADVLRQE